MAMKWSYLHPRTSTKAMRLEDFIDAEYEDRWMHPDEWSGDSARREPTRTSVLEERREWLDKALARRRARAEAENDNA